MKNYYDQLHELNIAKLRLKSLKEKKELYFQSTQPGGTSYDGERVTGGVPVNKYDNYVEKIEELDVEIKLVEAEIIILTEHLKDMEKELRQMKDPLAKIFVAIYIDGFTINHTCRITHYSRASVYNKLKIIKKILHKK